MQDIVSTFPVAFVYLILPFGDLAPHRAAPVTERNAAIHAPRGLINAVAVVERLLHLAKII
jgi:hypothetical protein